MVVREVTTRDVGVRAALARRFGVDLRALAALRIALGLLVLVDLVFRSFDLVAFYTDAGVLPRSLLREQYPAFASLSLHAVSGAVWTQAVLFAAAALVAVALLVGYRTRLATAVSCVLLVSLHLRNPLVLNGGDAVLRRLLFWGVFLPLGERWSLDAHLGRSGDARRGWAVAPRGRPGSRVATIASAALLIQVVLVYATNAVYKLRGDLWLRGDAVRYVFGLDQLTVGLGNVLADYPGLLVFADRVWLGLLVSSVFLLVLTGRARLLLASAFVAMHLGMAATMRLGLFPLISIAALLPFVPRSVWDRVEAELAPIGRRLGLASLVGGPRAGVSGSNSATSPLPGADRPTAAGRLRRLVGPNVVVVPLAFVLVWNAAAVDVVDLPADERVPLDPEEHRWDMFAPFPPTADWWFVTPGRLESGDRIDAFHRTAVSWDRPPDVADAYPSHRWYLYLFDLPSSEYEALRSHFAQYLCRRWNEGHDDDLVAVTVAYVEEPTRLDGPESTRRVALLEHRCSGAGRSAS